MAPDGADPCAGYHALQAENAKLNKLYNHELSCGKTMRDLSNEQAVRISALEAALQKCLDKAEATAWGWDGDCGLVGNIEWIVSEALEEREAAVELVEGE